MYTWNLYSDVYQLFLNKSGGESSEIRYKISVLSPFK